MVNSILRWILAFALDQLLKRVRSEIEHYQELKRRNEARDIRDEQILEAIEDAQRREDRIKAHRDQLSLL